MKAREDGVQDNIIYSATLFLSEGKRRRWTGQHYILSYAFLLLLLLLKARYIKEKKKEQEKIVYSATLCYLKVREDEAQDNII